MAEWPAFRDEVYSLLVAVSEEEKEK